jgi:hypothetical protein
LNKPPVEADPSFGLWMHWFYTLLFFPSQFLDPLSPAAKYLLQQFFVKGSDNYPLPLDSPLLRSYICRILDVELHVDLHYYLSQRNI